MKPRYNRTRLVLKTAMQKPATPAVSFKLSASQLYNSAGARDTVAQQGSRADARLLRLDNWQGAPEDIVARENAGKIPAMIPGYQLHALDNSETDWSRRKSTPPPGITKSEDDLIQAALIRVRNEKQLITDKPIAQRTEAEKTRLLELEEEETGLLTGGFLETIPGTIFGGGANGVYRRLSTANVPFCYTVRRLPSYLDDKGAVVYNSKLEARPWTIWLYRYKPRTGQIDHRFILELDLWRLEFEGDDRAIFYRINEERPAAERAKKDARREELRAKRKLSVVQSIQIEKNRGEIAKISADAKAAKKKVTEVEKARVKKLREDIKAIQAKVGLTDAEKYELKELDNYLFRQIETVELNETAQSLIGTAFSLTFIDTQVGYMQIGLDIGKNRWVFEDQWATARRIEKPLWGGDVLTIRGTGGAVAWRFGYVKVNAREEVVSGPEWVGIGADLSNVPVVGRWMTPKGTSVAFDVEPLQHGMARAVMVMKSDTRHMPVVFRATVQLPATASPAPEVLWDSNNVAGCVIGASVSLDAERRSPLWQLSLRCTEGFEAMELPAAQTGLTADIYVEGEKVLSDGVVVDDTLIGARDITDTPDVEAWGEVRLTVRDKSERVNDSRIDEEIELDGLWIGDAIYLLRRNMGATEDELSLLPRGPASGWKLSSAGAGDKAAYSPTLKSRRRDYIQNDLVKRFGLGRQYYFDAQGRDRLEFPSDRAVKDGSGQTIVFRPIAADANPNEPMPRYTYWSENGLERSRSFEGYYTYFEIFGAVDPDTKKKRSIAYRLNDATDPSNEGKNLYTGTDRPMEPVSDEAYFTAADLEVVLRTQIAIYGFPRETWPSRAPFSNILLAGEVFMVADAGDEPLPWRVRSVNSVDEISGDTVEVIWETPF